MINGRGRHESVWEALMGHFLIINYIALSLFAVLGVISTCRSAARASRYEEPCAELPAPELPSTARLFDTHLAPTHGPSIDKAVNAAPSLRLYPHLLPI